MEKKTNVKGKSYGFIAQEVEKILPSMVYTNHYGKKTIDYSKFCAILVESNREKDIKIDRLTKDVDMIKAQMNDVMKLLQLNRSQMYS